MYCFILPWKANLSSNMTTRFSHARLVLSPSMSLPQSTATTKNSTPCSSVVILAQPQIIVLSPLLRVGVQLQPLAMPPGQEPPTGNKNKKTKITRSPPTLDPASLAEGGSVEGYVAAVGAGASSSSNSPAQGTMKAVRPKLFPADGSRVFAMPPSLPLRLPHLVVRQAHLRQGPPEQ